MTEGEPTDRPADVDRRRVLLGMGAVGVAGVLAACGGDEPANPAAPENTPANTPEPADTPQPADTTEPADSDSADDSDDSPDEVAGALISTADVPVEGGVVLTDDEVVITQPSEGEFRAFSITCTHMGCPLNRVEDGLIRCICHGSRFHIDDGSVENGPATRPLEEVSITVEGDQIVRS